MFWHWNGVLSHTGYNVRARLDCWANSIWEITLLVLWKGKQLAWECKSFWYLAVFNPGSGWPAKSTAAMESKGWESHGKCRGVTVPGLACTSTVLLLPALLLSVEAIWIRHIWYPLLVSNALGQMPCWMWALASWPWLPQTETLWQLSEKPSCNPATKTLPHKSNMLS